MEIGGEGARPASVNTTCVSSEKIFIGIVPNDGPNIKLEFAMRNVGPYYSPLVYFLNNDTSLLLIRDEKLRVGLGQIDVRSIVKDGIAGISTHDTTNDWIFVNRVVGAGIAGTAILVVGGQKELKVTRFMSFVMALIVVR